MTLDPLTLPLRGSRLLEASAGTGKTWTVAALMLRLVLGHGGDNQAPPRALWPHEILVMTFTRAATRELRDRIRARLVQAAACFRAPERPDEPLLAALWQAYPSGAERQAAAWRLAAAAESMDEAAIHTIDAWCQRMLREHAFDSRSPFAEELAADEARMQLQAARDYWRQQVYPASEADAALILAVWRTVDDLADDAARLARGSLPTPAHPMAESLASHLASAREHGAQTLRQLADGWVHRVQEMRAWLEPRLTTPASPFDRRRLRWDHCQRWLADLESWAADPVAQQALLRPLLAGTMGRRLAPNGLQEAAKGGEALDWPPAFAAFEALVAAVSVLPDEAAAIRQHAAVHVAHRVQQLKQQQQCFGFEDQLRRLDSALDPGPSGPAAARLRERILAQYPVALVDEFQDTSALQLRIFDRLYRIADNDPSRLLLLIGDPKQAIYSFRGADIRSYLRAREATQGRHERLGVNHRSTLALVDAVNALFARAEARPGPGAFLFRQPGVAEADNPVPFVAVGARGRAAWLEGAGGPAPALSLCVDEQPRGAAEARAHLARQCAQRVVDWLSVGRLHGLDGPAPSRPLSPGDIAVLVRTGTEADAVRLALRQRGVASVYLSDRDSVFASPEATDVLRLMQAVATPRDQRLARAALATGLVGLPLPALRQLADDDSAFEAQAARLRELLAVWQAQGVLAMLRRALHALGVPARCLAGGPAQGTDGGERRLTNALHLAELLQQASQQVEGEQALIRWLVQAMAEARAGQAGAEDQVLRLESDADLVQVVTVHKSKGLQYPLVCVPFASSVASGTEPDALLLPGPTGDMTWTLRPTPADQEAAQHLRLQEDLRLLYVALTRAELACWVGLPVMAEARTSGQRTVWPRSAFGHLLTGTDEFDRQRVREALQEVQSCAGAVEIVEATPVPSGAARWQPPAPAAALQAARVYRGRFDRSWVIGSYSAMVRDAVPGDTPTLEGSAAPGAGGEDGSTPDDAQGWDARLRGWRLDEPQEAGPGAAEAALPQAPLPEPRPWAAFPRGAFAGNFLHAQLEWLAGEGFGAIGSSAALQQALRNRCDRAARGAWADGVLEWMQRLCQQPLPRVGLPLAGLAVHIPELEFWFPSDGLDTAAIDRLCRQHLWPGHERPALVPRQLHGLLMGFADLVFEHQGCYWVLDYKSNDLVHGRADAGTAQGSGAVGYGHEARRAAMLEHRYDVQAALYLLALHRLLRARLGARYRPEQQLGGALYWFIRGVDGPQGGCEAMDTPWPLVDALDRCLAPLGSADGEGEYLS